MEMNFFNPTQIVENNIKTGVTKANLNVIKMMIMGFFAGLFIAIGAEGSNLAIHTVSNVGLSRTLAGAVFPVGLMLVIIIGGELFTGNCMIIMAVVDGKARLTGMLKNWILVYLSNFLGALFAAYAVFASGQFDYSDGGLGAFTIKVAMGKTGLSFDKEFFSGIMCNILVCLAVLMCSASKDIIGKIFAAFFPIMVFVISGFEHCVANMYYIPAGMIAATNDKYVDKTCELYGYTADQIHSQLNVYGFGVKNLIPVTLGNIVGGCVVVSLGLYAIWKIGKSKEEIK